MSEEHPSVWDVRISQTAAAMIRNITDMRIRRKILDSISELRYSPELKGKSLTGELARFRSVRAVGQRYRILYLIEAGQVVVYVVAVGIRKDGDREDIYKLAQRLMRLGLLGPDSVDAEKP